MWTRFCVRIDCCRLHSYNAEWHANLSLGLFVTNLPSVFVLLLLLVYVFLLIWSFARPNGCAAYFLCSTFITLKLIGRIYQRSPRFQVSKKIKLMGSSAWKIRVIPLSLLVQVLFGFKNIFQSIALSHSLLLEEVSRINITVQFGGMDWYPLCTSSLNFLVWLVMTVGEN